MTSPVLPRCPRCRSHGDPRCQVNGGAGCLGECTGHMDMDGTEIPRYSRHDDKIIELRLTVPIEIRVPSDFPVTAAEMVKLADWKVNDRCDGRFPYSTEIMHQGASDWAILDRAPVESSSTTTIASTTTSVAATATSARATSSSTAAPRRWDPSRRTWSMAAMSRSPPRRAGLTTSATRASCTSCSAATTARRTAPRATTCWPRGPCSRHGKRPRFTPRPSPPAAIPSSAPCRRWPSCALANPAALPRSGSAAPRMRRRHERPRREVRAQARRKGRDGSDLLPSRRSKRSAWTPRRRPGRVVASVAGWRSSAEIQRLADEAAGREQSARQARELYGTLLPMLRSCAPDSPAGTRDQDG